MIPQAVMEPLKGQIAAVRVQHEDNRARGAGHVALPDALTRKYPHASPEFRWQWLFPATRTYQHPPTGRDPPPPPARNRHPAGRESRRPASSHHQSRQPPHPPPQLRDPPPRGWLRHPHHPGTARPPRRQHHHDLHPRPEPRPGRRPQPPSTTDAPQGPSRIRLQAHCAKWIRLRGPPPSRGSRTSAKCARS